MNFTDYISSLTVEQLREHVNVLNNAIVQKLAAPASLQVTTQNLSSDLVNNIDDFFEYHDSFLDNTEAELLLAECLSLGFKKRTPSKNVQNKFVSSFSDPYSWSSSNGPVINHPIEMDNCPIIKSTMARINSEFGYSLNCSLVSYYKDGSVNARLHSDNEKELDEEQPIVVVSLGAVRTVQFVDNNQESFRTAALSVSPEAGSVYIMRPGCQQRFRHRVRMNKKVKDFRISLSFRAFVPPKSDTSKVSTSASSFATPGSQVPDSPFCTEHPLSSSPKSVVKDSSPRPVIVKPLEQLGLDSTPLIRKFKAIPKTISDVLPAVSVNKGVASASVTKGVAPASVTNPDVCGYSPFTTGLESSSKETADVPHNSSNEKICVIFGTSITLGVDEKMMSKGNRTVVNVSVSGADIDCVRKLANDFQHDNIRSIHKIDKIIVNVGTNDVKWYNCFARNMKRDFKQKLVNLIKELKQLFPFAQIHFQTILPIRIVYKYTAASIHQFNYLLLEVCTQYQCFFFDCFSRFLDKNGNFPNSTFYRDNWHLNNIGLKVLCRALKYLIYSNLFNPLPRISCYPKSYHLK